MMPAFDTSDDTPDPWEFPLTVADLATGRATEFTMAPDSGVRQYIARALGIQTVRKLQFSGRLSPIGKSDWQLSAKLGASVVQACVVSLDPVATRIDEMVERSFVRVVTEHEAGSEVEIPDDETIEAIGSTIDPGLIMVEALALALPQFPRTHGAELIQSQFTQPGKPTMTDADARPFAHLKSLRDGLKNDTG